MNILMTFHSFIFEYTSDLSSTEFTKSKKRKKRSIPRNNIYILQTCSGKATPFCLARI